MSTAAMAVCLWVACCLLLSVVRRTRKYGTWLLLMTWWPAFFLLRVVDRAYVRLVGKWHREYAR